MTKPVVVITIGQMHYPRMMSQAAWERLAAFAEVVEHAAQEPAAKADLLALLPGADACITSWDVARLDADVVAAAPRLRLLAHMGGSVRRVVSDAVWARGIRVTSAAPRWARTWLRRPWDSSSLASNASGRWRSTYGKAAGARPPGGRRASCAGRSSASSAAATSAGT